MPLEKDLRTAAMRKPCPSDSTLITACTAQGSTPIMAAALLISDEVSAMLFAPRF
jgi:hypothetical protein